MAAGHLRAPGLAAQGAPDSLHLIRGNGNADAGGANDDSPVLTSLRHIPGRRSGKVRVVAAIMSGASVIRHLMPLFRQPDAQFLFQIKAAVVGRDCDFHSLFSYFLNFLKKLLCSS